MKVASFQDGWLLPHSPDLSQKSGSLKQRALWAFSSPDHPPADGLAPRVQGRIRTYLLNSCEPISQPVRFKLVNPGRRERTFRGFKSQPREETGFPYFPSPCLLYGGCFLWVPAACPCFRTPNKRLSFFNCWFRLLPSAGREFPCSCML